MPSSSKKSGSFVMLDRELIRSASWRTMSINCRRLLDFLFNEHLSKGGKENGQLKATYSQLVQFGISRRLVHQTIFEAEQRGLILVERGGRKGFVSDMNTFTITFLSTWKYGHWIKATHDWRYIDSNAYDQKQKSKLLRGTQTVPLSDHSQFH